ncbi:MAG: DUF1552 domain-containing protein [Sandaracinaceae bacterium]
MRPRRFLPRRTFLRGALATGAGAVVGLPVLDAMLDSGGALADGGRYPDRFVLWFWGNGNIPEEWAPSTTGPGWEPTEQLEGLRAFKDKVHVISGTELPVANQSNPHAEGVVAILGGTNAVTSPDYHNQGDNWDWMTYAGPTIDEVAAGVVGTAPFRSLSLTLTTPRESLGPGTVIEYISHRAPYLPNPATRDPAAVFDRLFGTGTPRVGAPTRDELARASVLDAVLADARSLDARLGASDRARLELHLDSIRDLESRLSRTITNACTPPERAEMALSDRENARLLNELAALAFACDLTRVIAVQMSSPASLVDFPDPFPSGLVSRGQNVSYHVYVHENGPDRTAIRGVAYFMEVLGDLLGTLDGTMEADRSLLDRSVVFGTTEVSNGWDHRFYDFPLLIAGGGNGRLRPGSHVRTSGLASRGALTCLRALGSDAASWGADQLYTTDPVSEILT